VSANALGVRSKPGVLAFGNDSEIRKALKAHGIIEEGFHSIEPERLNFDSAEFGLLRDAFGKAVERCRPLTVKKRRRESAHICTLDCSRITPAEQESLRRCAGQLAGTIPSTTLQWSEALIIKLDFRLGRLWCLIEPAIYVPGDRTPQERSTSRRLGASGLLRVTTGSETHCRCLGRPSCRT
jgi:hypothetical protein